MKLDFKEEVYNYSVRIDFKWNRYDSFWDFLFPIVFFRDRKKKWTDWHDIHNRDLLNVMKLGFTICEIFVIFTINSFIKIFR